MSRRRATYTALHEVILIGADLTHLEVIKRFQKLLVKPFRLTLYHPNHSALLQGFIPSVFSGDLTKESVTIDLGHLCLSAGVELIEDPIIALSLKDSRIETKNSIRFFDLASLSPNATFDGLELLGHLENTVIKQWEKFHFRGESLLSAELAIIAKSRIKSNPTCVLETSQSQWPIEIASEIQKKLASAQIEIVVPNSKLPAHSIDLEMEPPKWFKNSDLELGSNGWPNFKEGFSSKSANIIFHSPENSGFLYSWKPTLEISRHRGKVLFHNLENHFSGHHHIQAEGDRWAGPILNFAQPIWKFGNRIARIPNLSHMKLSAMLRLASQFQMKPEKFRIPTFMESGIIYDQPCEGTGAKIAFLERQLSEMTFHSNIEHLDAGGITRLKDGTFLIQSLEYISQLHIDYFRYGEVVARHSINQLEAKGVIPESTMLVFTIPFGTKGMMSKDVDAMQKGMYKVLSQEKISVLGSYSRCANKPAAGIMIQGFHDPKSDGLMFSLNPQPGKKKIILTKKIGTGLLFEAHKHYYLSTSILNEIIDDLLVSQLDALRIFKKHKVTQVGGIDAFGAAKVIETMLGPEQFARIHLMKIPTWSGLIPSIEQGVRTALHAQNRSAYMDQVMVLQQSPLLRAELLFDPQTAGAWIAFVEPDHADQILSDLQSSNMTSASIIGDVDTTTARHKVTLVP